MRPTHLRDIALVVKHPISSSSCLHVATVVSCNVKIANGNYVQIIFSSIRFVKSDRSPYIVNVLMENV